MPGLKDSQDPTKVLEVGSTPTPGANMECYRVNITKDAMITIEYIDEDDVIHCESIEVFIDKNNNLTINKWHDYEHMESSAGVAGSMS